MRFLPLPMIEFIRWLLVNKGATLDPQANLSPDTHDSGYYVATGRLNSIPLCQTFKTGGICGVCVATMEDILEQAKTSLRYSGQLLGIEVRDDALDVRVDFESTNWYEAVDKAITVARENGQARIWDVKAKKAIDVPPEAPPDLSAEFLRRVRDFVARYGGAVVSLPNTNTENTQNWTILDPSDIDEVHEEFRLKLAKDHEECFGKRPLFYIANQRTAKEWTLGTTNPKALVDAVLACGAFVCAGALVTNEGVFPIFGAKTVKETLGMEMTKRVLGSRSAVYHDAPSDMEQELLKRAFKF